MVVEEKNVIPPVPPTPPIPPVSPFAESGKHDKSHITLFIRGFVLIILYIIVGELFVRSSDLSTAITKSEFGMISFGMFMILMTAIVCFANRYSEDVEDDDDDIDDLDDEDEEEAEEAEEVVWCEKCEDELYAYDPKPYCAACVASVNYWYKKMNPETPVQENKPEQEPVKQG